MIDRFEYIVYRLFEPDQAEDSFSIFDPLGQFDEDVDDHIGIARSLTAAFLITLALKGPSSLAGDGFFPKKKCLLSFAHTSISSSMISLSMM